MHYPDVEHRTAQSEIAKVLECLCRHRVVVAVRLPGDGGTYSSVILLVDRPRRQFVLDEMVPSPGNAKMTIQQRLRLQARYSGAEISARAHVEETSFDEGVPYHRIALPDEVSLRQRRRSLRVSLPTDEPIKVKLGDHEDIVIEGDVLDISADGMGLRLSLVIWNKASALVQPGVQLTGVRFSLPDTAPIVCDLQIRNVREAKGRAYPGQPQAVRVGAQIVGITPADQYSIEDFVQSRQRQFLRHLRLD